MSSNRSKESETRVRILEATWQLMEERNGQGVRMRDVAESDNGIPNLFRHPLGSSRVIVAIQIASTGPRRGQASPLDKA